MVKKRLTPLQIEQILQKLRDGVAMYKIADEFGITQQAVDYQSKKHNIVRPRAKEQHKRAIRRDSCLHLALQIFEDEKNYSEIGRALQMSRQRVQQAVKKFRAETVS